MSLFELPLSKGQWIIAGVLMAIALIAGFVNFAVLAHVSRMRPGSRISNRLLPFGLGAWHIGMLRRDWYPEDALPLRRWALGSYAISMACLIILGGLMASWGGMF